MDHEKGTCGMAIDYCIMKEGMSILRGWKSVPGISNSERENGKNVLLRPHVNYMIKSLYELLVHDLGQADVANVFNDTNLFNTCLDEQNALNMVRSVSDREVKEALFSMGDDKSPGLDGYTAAFFKEAWTIVGDEVSNAIREFFTNGKLLKELNHTVIALIPKEGMSILRGRKSVPGINSCESGNGKKRTTLSLRELHDKELV
nr:hypothetical protein [Tanacetum cinerariifolium]